MKFTIAGAVLALALMSCSAWAQTNEPKKETHKNTHTVTGCMQKDGDEYQVTTKDGSTWEVKSDSLNLAQHVGHTVTVTGAVSNAALHGAKEDTKAEAKEHGIDKNSTEHGHMTVTNLKMVSRSCEK
jgi:opacity protein-like surface antigen